MNQNLGINYTCVVIGTTTLHFPLLAIAYSLENGAPYFYVERTFVFPLFTSSLVGKSFSP